MADTDGMDKKKVSTKSVTLRTIADELGISATAVSNALQGRGNISVEMTKKVKETAERLNYIPNSVARSLRTNRTRTIGLIVSDSSVSFFAELIEGIEKTAADKGYNIILCNAYSSVEKEKEAVRILVNKRVDGLILAASMLNSTRYRSFLDSFGVPYIFAVRKCESGMGMYVVNDNVYGSVQMTDYLLKTGSKSVYFINVHEKIESYSGRMEGYKKALERHKVEFDPKKVSNAEPTVEGGYAAMSCLLAKVDKDDLEAVYCGCDVIAIGAMEAILDRGLKIPEDIRIAGYDDIEYAAYLRVPLTTVRQPKYRMGQIATGVIIDIINGSRGNAASIELKPELVIRAST